MFFTPILAGATERLSTQGYSVIVAYVGSDAKAQLDLAGGLIARRVDGLILATVVRDDPLAAFCIAVGAADGARQSSGKGCAIIGSSFRRHARNAACRRSPCRTRTPQNRTLAGPSQHSTGFLRRRGFTQATASHGLPAAQTPFEIAETYTRKPVPIRRAALLHAHPEITAIVAANDLLALGAYDVLREEGLECPRDISIVGHNDMPLVDMVQPPLTTIRISHKEMGRQAADLLQQGHRDAR